MLSTNAHRELDTMDTASSAVSRAGSEQCDFFPIHIGWIPGFAMHDAMHLGNPEQLVCTSCFPGIPPVVRGTVSFPPAAMMTTSPFRPENGTQSNVALCESDICEDRTPMDPRQLRSKFAKGVGEMIGPAGKTKYMIQVIRPFAAILQHNASITGGSDLVEGREQSSKISARRMDHVSHRSEAFAPRCTGADLFLFRIAEIEDQPRSKRCAELVGRCLFVT
jgi:hypothetical protein